MVDYYNMEYLSDPEERLSVREVARACNRTEETIRRWIWSGKLPATKLGNQLFVKRQDLDALRLPKLGEASVKYKTRTDMEDEYEYTASGDAIEDEKYLASKYEEARNIADDEKWQDEVLAKFGGVNVVELLDQLRNG